MQDYNAKHAQMKILPRYKVKTEGEAVSTPFVYKYATVSDVVAFPLYILIFLLYFVYDFNNK